MMTKLKVLRCILLSLLTFAETAYGQEDCHCPAVVYLLRGTEGKIQCQCNDFSLVSWYRSEEDFDNGGTPFITYDNSETTGPGKTSEEYDVGVNGSLIITNVSLVNHGRTYFGVFLRETKGQTVKERVKVEVLVIPDPPYPVVEGRIHQQHVYMDVSRNGKLSCSMRVVHPNVSLTWTVLDPSQSNQIQILPDEMGTHKTQNEDGTYDIRLSSMFRVTDPSILRITIQCGVANEMGKYFSEKTKVDLLFSAVYPVVNGHVNQKHVYLDVDREGHLTCLKENVDVHTRLVWVLDPNMRGKVNFESNTTISINIDGTRNINQTFDYEVHDHSLERITIECKVIEPDTNEHPYTTTVELLFTNVPVISGCYHQDHSCSLEVGRKGELTCTIKNSHYPVDLKWTTLDGDKYLVFEEDRVRSQNNTNSFDISITTPYTVIDDKVTSVTVQCDAYKSPSDQVLETSQASLVIQTQTSLVIQTADDSNNKTLLVTLVVILSLFLVFTWLLLVISHYSNRKLFKKSEAKYLNLLDCKSKDNGNPIPEDTTDQHEHNYGGRLRLMPSLEDCSLNTQQDTTDLKKRYSDGRRLRLMPSLEDCSLNTQQDTTDLKKLYSDGGRLRLMPSLEDCSLNTQQDTTDPKKLYSDGRRLHVVFTSKGWPPVITVERIERNNSSDSHHSPDSGNPGNSSREQSGIEPFETSGDMESSFCHEKQGSSDDKRGCSEGDPMVCYPKRLQTC